MATKPSKVERLYSDTRTASAEWRQNPESKVLLSKYKKQKKRLQSSIVDMRHALENIKEDC